MRNNMASTNQPAPQEGQEIVLNYVLEDLRDRANMGLEKYGTYLKTHNGRSALWDSYQEALDLCMYLRQKILEETRDLEHENQMLRASLGELLEQYELSDSTYWHEEIIDRAYNALGDIDRAIMPICYDCGLSYRYFPLDNNVPDKIWEVITPSDHKEGGLLCANCVMHRLSRLSNPPVYVRMIPVWD